MKIAVNTRLLVPDNMDGIGWFTYETLNRLSSKHPEHEFIFIFDRSYPKEFIFNDNVRGLVLSPQARIPILWYTWFEFALPRLLKRLKVDLFLSQEGWIPTRRPLNIPTLAVIHDLNFEHHPENIVPSHRRYLKRFFPRFAAKADRIATVSEYSKRDIINCYGVPEEKIDVVYNGVNEAIAPIAEDRKEQIREQYTKGAPYFIFVGTLHPRKNLQRLFEAFDLFKKNCDSDLKLVIAGKKKWWPKELETSFQGLKHKNDIIFTGRLESQELYQLLGAAFAMTYVPQFEGFGIPLLEAMQAEIPIITSNVTSMPEVAEEAAIYCDPFQTSSIAKAMQELYEDPALGRWLIEAGKKRRMAFSWEKTTDLLWESMLKTLKKN